MLLGEWGMISFMGSTIICRKADDGDGLCRPVDKARVKMCRSATDVVVRSAMATKAMTNDISLAFRAGFYTLFLLC